MKNFLFSGLSLLAIAPFAYASEPQPNTPEWGERELRNYSKTLEAPQRQAGDNAFQQVWLSQSTANHIAYDQRQLNEPMGWNSYGNICQTWEMQCTGDPYRYPDAPGRWGQEWYGIVGEVEPVNFFDRDGARISGRVWRPTRAHAQQNCPANKGKGRAMMEQFPGIVIINGSVQAPEPLYWWAAQLLVENCYTVMTFDPRGQGRSDTSTPSGDQGSNANPVVFETGLVDAIDFFYSTEDKPYYWNLYWAENGRTADTTASNPFTAALDRARFGIAGHSMGARGVSSVQGLTGESWTGRNVAENPVKVGVAWDNLALSSGNESSDGFSPITPRVPTMGQSADYFLTPTPYMQQPDSDEKRSGFLTWREAGIPSMQVNIQGGTHYEWSLLPTFPTSDWQPGGGATADTEGWGNPLAQYYTLAWFDYWLKKPNEIGGGEDAQARLLDDCAFQERFSFYFASSRYLDTSTENNSADGMNSDDLRTTSCGG